MIRFALLFTALVAVTVTYLAPDPSIRLRDTPVRQIAQAYLDARDGNEVGIETRLRRLRSERTRLFHRYQLLNARNELLEATLDHQAAGNGLFLRPTPGAVDGAIERLERSFELLDARDDVAIGAAALPTETSTRRTGVSVDPVYLAGRTEDGRSYCIQYREYTGDGLNPSSQWPSSSGAPTIARARVELGLCSLVARFGYPGEDVARWIERSAFDFAALPWTGPGAIRDQALETNFEPSETVVLLRSCLAGWDDSCAALLDPKFGAYTIWEHGRTYGGIAPMVVDTDVVPWGSFAQRYRPGILYELADADPDRFQAFWASDLPLEEAFESAWGRSIGEWFRTDFISVRAATFGPSPTGSEWLVSLAWASLLALIGILVELRRRVA